MCPLMLNIRSTEVAGTPRYFSANSAKFTQDGDLKLMKTSLSSINFAMLFF